MRFSLLALAFFISPVQGLAQSWCGRAPRPGFETLQRIPVSDEWFHVYRVDPNVYALYEPYNFQEVISYLIVGQGKALLFDTGMGMSRISTVVRELTRLPVTVVNSHTHYDHVGGNAEFDDILSLDTEFTRESAKGIPHAAVAVEATPEGLCRERLSLPFDTAAYSIRPFKTSRFIKHGDTINLGNRVLEVLQVPGHTPDAIALVDRANGLLFTGDTFYEGPIWLFFPGTDLDSYASSIGRLADLAPRLRKVFPAHNTAVASPSLLPEVRDAFARVRAGTVAYTDKGDGTVDYPADGFSFLMRKPEPPLRVLFIGNSYTYYNNLPEILTGLAAGAYPARKVTVEMIVRGGATLQQHWMNGEALRRIEDGHWDSVVLQEQSMLGVALLDGAPAINAPALFHRYARLFDRAIRRAGARTVLYSTWSRRGTPSTHQAALDAAYASLGRELGAVVAPVGAVWQRVHAAQPTLELYDPDGSHPSPAGSYLAGTVLWSALSGRSPEFLPSRLTGHLLVDTALGTRLSDSLGVLAALPDGDARQVQHAAAEVFGEQKAAGGALATPMAGSMAGSISASMATPTASPLSLPAGRALTAEALLGTWSGTLRLFDQPAEMALRVSRRDGAFRGELTVRYAAGAGTRSTVVQDFAADGTTLRFTVADPRFLAPPEAYRAVLTGDTLVGVAEVGDPEHVPHLMGHWTLRRRP